MTINEVNYYIRSAQNGKSIKLNKEKQKFKIVNLIPHHFCKILNYFLICERLSLALVKKHFFTNNTSLKPRLTELYACIIIYPNRFIVYCRVESSLALSCDQLSVIISVTFYIMQRQNKFAKNMLKHFYFAADINKIILVYVKMIMCDIYVM